MRPAAQRRIPNAELQGGLVILSAASPGDGDPATKRRLDRARLASDRDYELNLWDDFGDSYIAARLPTTLTHSSVRDTAEYLSAKVRFSYFLAHAFWHNFRLPMPYSHNFAAKKFQCAPRRGEDIK